MDCEPQKAVSIAPAVRMLASAGSLDLRATINSSTALMPISGSGRESPRHATLA